MADIRNLNMEDYIRQLIDEEFIRKVASGKSGPYGKNEFPGDPENHRGTGMYERNKSPHEY